MLEFISFYIYLLVAGIVGLAISNKIFKDWIDKGYGFSKAIGVFTIGVPIWLLSSLNVVNFTSYLQVFTCLVLILTISLYSLYLQKFKINKYMILEELLFFLVFLIWTIIRSTNPRTEGTEKMMNMAFINSIDKTEYFPPKDPWYSSETINYYYMGHYFTTLLSNLSGVATHYAYNFSLVAIISQVFVSLFSIILNLKPLNFFSDQYEILKSANKGFEQKIENIIFFFINKRKQISNILVSLIITFVVTFGGNLHYATALYTHFFKSTFYKIQELFGVQEVGVSEFTYYFPESTRIISKTINEFPSYSVVLGDLHPHYLVLPFFILAIGFSLVLIKVDITNPKKWILNACISPFIIMLYSINSWDFITINILFIFIHIYQFFSSQKDILDRIKGFVISQLSILIPGLIVMIPFLLNFNPPVGGLGTVPFEESSTYYQVWNTLADMNLKLNISLPANLFRILYIILPLILGYYLLRVRKVIMKYVEDLKQIEFYSIVVLIISLALVEIFWLEDIRTILNGLNIILTEDTEIFVTFRDDMRSWFKMWGGYLSIILVFLAGLILNTKYKLFKKFDKKETFWIIIVSILSAGLIFGVEIFFMKDIFYKSNPPFYRTNTVFKFYYHAWIILGIVVGWNTKNIIFNMIKKNTLNKIYRFISTLLITIIFFSMSIYIIKAVDDFYFGNEEIEPTMDGMDYIRREYPGDYEAINYLRKSVKGQPVIIEAVGGAYTYYARVSTYTGLPTVMGWPTHEWQWRDDSSSPFQREGDVSTIYTTEDKSVFIDLIKKYNVEYIYLGEKEREKYTQIAKNKIESFSDIIYEKNNTIIYKINNEKLKEFTH